MDLINTNTHGILDYILGVAWIGSPWILGFAAGGAETIIPVFTGTCMILYSLLTQYEAALFEIIPVPLHLAFDRAGAILLLISPWLFGFAHEVWFPHVLAGLVQFILTVITIRTSNWTRLRRMLRNRYEAGYSASL